jgi:hypothetical protein
MSIQRRAVVSKYAKDQKISCDFESHTMNMLESLMLAAAQEIICEEAITSKKGNNNLAALFISAAKLYEKVHQHAADFSKEIEDHVKFKASWCNARAEYFQSEFDGENGEHGTQIARLEKVLNYLSGSRKQLGVADFVETVKVIVQKAKNDNNILYMQQIPTHVDEIEPKQVAAKVKFDEKTLLGHRAPETLPGNATPDTLLEKASPDTLLQTD